MSARRLYLDIGPGETRGVVTLDGKPERLLIDRTGEDRGARCGDRWIARVRRRDASSATAFLDLGLGGAAVLALVGAASALAEGAAVEVEVSAEARRGKSAVARLIGPAAGAPRPTSPPRSVEDRLTAFAPGQAMVQGLEARLIADDAETEVLAWEHALAGGGSLAIEPTRALVAVDVDLAAAGAGEARSAARRANLAAIAATARLLRLKSLGGLIAVDLIGKGHDGASLSAAAEAAFAPDQPGVSIGAINRFGLMTLVKPWRERPLSETLCAPDGRPSAATVALRLLRALEREGWADRGARLIGRCSPAAAQASAAYIADLTGRLGARFAVEADPQMADDRFETRTA